MNDPADRVGGAFPSWRSETMSLPKAFSTFAEFQREIIRPANRIGLTLEEMVEDNSFDAEIEFDQDDPFAEMKDEY